jgi:hypothetical protein
VGNLVDAVFQVASGYISGTGDTIVLGRSPQLIADANGNQPGSLAGDDGQLPLDGPVDYVTTYDSGEDVTLPAIGSGEVWGGQSVGGFYNVTRVTDTSVLLGAKVFSVPTGWTCPSGDMTTAFGRLRFPDCPGILGRVAISAITNASPCHLTIDSSPYLAMKLTASPPSSEQVDLCAADMTVIASDVALTRVSDTEFTVSTAYATIAQAKYIVVHGAAAWYWNDQWPKGKVITQEFYFDYRMPAEVTRIDAIINACNDQGSFDSQFVGCSCGSLGSLQTYAPIGEFSNFVQNVICVPWTQCNPRVVRTLDFPTDFPFDADFGSQWQACVVSAVQDPLWQRPHHPPKAYNELWDSYSDYAWVQDNGSCEADVTDGDGFVVKRFYAHPPVVEPFLSLPGTDGWPGAGAAGTEVAPELPAGVSYALESPVDTANSNTVYPPADGGELPWTFHAALCWSIQGSQRFAGDYMKFTLGC